MSEQPIEMSDAERQAAIEAARARAAAQAGGQVYSPEEAAAAVQPAAGANPGLDAGLQQIQSAPPAAGEPLPAESEQDKIMELLKAQSAQLQAALAKIGALEGQFAQAMAEQSAAGGDPLVVRYAKAVRDKLLTHATMHPDLGGVVNVPVATSDGKTVLQPTATGHFESVLQMAEGLVSAAEAVASGAGPAGAVIDGADAVVRWMERGHKRATNKFVDFSAAIDDAEQAGDEARKLQAAA